LPVTEQDAAVAALLTVLRISRVMERIDAGVSPQQYRMLKLIGAGGERSARLAEKLAVARPTLTSTADSLVAAGLAIREAEEGDRRVVRLCLTPAGQAAVERADEAYGAWFSSLLSDSGRGPEILADFRLLEDAMTERHRARHAADATAGAADDSAGQR
jgi:DNA-binding MarR family transcriptional regulator